MALEVIYEGQISGTVNADLSGTAVSGKMCFLSKSAGATKAANTVYFDTITVGTDRVAGLIADSTQDVIASGKVSFYTTQGVYKTDQFTGSPVKGGYLSVDTNGFLTTTNSTDIVALCEEAADSAGMIKIKLL